MPTTYAIPNGAKVMDATLYTGTGSAATITNAGGFYPDFTWIKDRTNAYNHILVNSVVGPTIFLSSNVNSAESNTAGLVTALNANGFSVGTVANVNQNADNYVAWQWKAGANTTVSNTSGSITSTVSANVTAGFSIVTFTVSGSGTIGHGLGVAPSLVITKTRSTTGNWFSWHSALGATQVINLNTTAAAVTDATIFGAAPTSSVISYGSTWASGGPYTQVAYCWAEVAGFSKFGSYTGNGNADGPFIYTGFRPKFILYKRTDTTGDWYIFDTSRSTYNAMNNVLFPNSSNAEDTGGFWIDGLSNGFKQRGTGANSNANGGTYIYAAFAETPFKYSNAR